jgi:Uma2 family endonuclease
MTTVLAPPDQGIVLEGISWETYERLLSEHQDSASTRFTYDRETLEIMVLSAKHEKYKDLITLLVNVLAEEMGVDVSSFGSTTFRRQDLARGFEPDACFYIQKIDQVMGKDELDLTVDPAPDLVIEIDMSSSSLDRFPLFAAVGVNEVWRYNGDRLTLFVLTDGDYAKKPYSAVLPKVSGQALTALMTASQTLRRTAWLRQVREWVRANVVL